MTWLAHIDKNNIDVTLFWFVSTVLPVFTQLSHDTSVKVGSNINISCHANGEPQPIITWNKVRAQGKSSKYSNIKNIDKCIDPPKQR